MDIFDKKIDLLIEYLQTHDNMEPMQSEIYKNVRLKSFINTIRNIYNKGKLLEDGSIKYKKDILTKDQIDKLDSNSFNWKRLTKEENFTKNVKLLNEYLQLNKNKYPRQGTIYKNVNIGNWVITLRKIYEKGEHQKDDSIKYNSMILTKNQIDELNKINFIWDKEEAKEKQIEIGKTKKDTWLIHYKLLKKYIEETNDTSPSIYEYYEDFDLGAWANKQRSIFNLGTLRNDNSLIYGTNILTEERIEMLNEINFTWVINKKKFFESEINSLEEYNKKKRVLLEELKKMLKEKKNINDIDEEFIKILNK